MEGKYNSAFYSEEAASKQSDFLKITLGFLLFLGCTYLLYPLCHYYVDPDSTAYLPIIKRYATGDLTRAFNGLWSPLHPALSGLLMGISGIDAYDAALTINVLSALLIVFLSYKLFSFFRKQEFEQWGFIVFSAIFWSVAVYFQLEADLLGIAFGLWFLFIFFTSNLLKSHQIWFKLGLIAGLAIYAKTYNSYALTLILFCYLLTQWRQKNLSIQKGILYFLGYLMILGVVIFPYLYLTHAKYGIWAPGLSGKLNTTWYTVGRQLFLPQIKTLIPPIYPNSVSYWEDPFWVQGQWPTFTTNTYYFLRYLLRIGSNLIDWIVSMNHISFLFSTIWLISLGSFLKKHHRLLGVPHSKLILVNLCFPIGLLLVHIESRYLWLSLFSILILGLIYLEKWAKALVSPPVFRIFILLFFGSFLIGTVQDLKGMLFTGKAEFNLAQTLKEKNIRGAFCSNLGSTNEEEQTLVRLSYFSGNPFYVNPQISQSSFQEIAQDARRYHVPYYYFFYKGQSSPIALLDNQGIPLPEITHGSIPGLLIFSLSNSNLPPITILP